MQSNTTNVICSKTHIGIHTHTHTHLRDGVNHVQAHLHTAVGMVSFWLGQAADTVVAIPQNLNPPAVVLLSRTHTHTHTHTHRHRHTQTHRHRHTHTHTHSHKSVLMASDIPKLT